MVTMMIISVFQRKHLATYFLCLPCALITQQLPLVTAVITSRTTQWSPCLVLRVGEQNDGSMVSRDLICLCDSGAHNEQGCKPGYSDPWALAC